MVKPVHRGWGEYCVLQDAKCTGILFCLGGLDIGPQDKIVVDIATEDETILKEFTLPFLRRPYDLDDGDDNLGIAQEELPSIIKFRSGDVIRCFTRAEILGVYLKVLDQNESGNDDVYIQPLDMDDRPPKRPLLTSLPSGRDSWKEIEDGKLI